MKKEKPDELIPKSLIPAWNFALVSFKQIQKNIATGMNSF